MLPILWIVCDNSRVPANEITGSKPEEIFVYKNIANMMVRTDMCMPNVLDYGVNMLDVSHVIVCGHFGSEGLHAALERKQFGIIGNWLRHIKDVCRSHKDEIDFLPMLREKQRRMVEVNVRRPVHDLTKTLIDSECFSAGRMAANARVVS